MKNSRSIYFLTGLSGVGKTYFERIIKARYAIPTFYSASIIPEGIDKREWVLQGLLEEPNGFIKCVVDKALEQFPQEDLMIDALRSPEEWSFVKNYLADIETVLISLYCDDKIRERRVLSRDGSLDHLKERDNIDKGIAENSRFNVPKLQQMADYHIDTGTPLEERLSGIFRHNE
ncbi:MAG: hypothetical protein GXP63_03875 [DPANN group archaeon]|nr:hypothetical protein [DPANN group archaeon]